MTNTAYILPDKKITAQVIFSGRAKHYEHYPLIRGDKAPVLSLDIENFIAIDSKKEQDINVKSFIETVQDNSKPIVLIFFPMQSQKRYNLKCFESLHEATRDIGASLLILTNSTAYSFKNTFLYNHTLNVFDDSKNMIARSFGLYDPQNPLWNWIPGIEEKETFLPALYVIAPDRRIVYHYIDYNFSLFDGPDTLYQSFAAHILDAVNNTARKHFTIPLAIN